MIINIYIKYNMPNLFYRNYSSRIKKNIYINYYYIFGIAIIPLVFYKNKPPKLFNFICNDNSDNSN